MTGCFGAKLESMEGVEWDSMEVPTLHLGELPLALAWALAGCQALHPALHLILFAQLCSALHFTAYYTIGVACTETLFLQVLPSV